MDNSEELDMDQENEVSSIDQHLDTNGQAEDNKQYNAVSQAYNYNQSQLQWTNRQVSNLERELLLNNNRFIDNNSMSNWTKVILAALAVFIPGIGQIIGVILGLVFVSNDINADKRSYGAALITVSVVAFIISMFFWFIFAMAFGPQLYY